MQRLLNPSDPSANAKPGSASAAATVATGAKGKSTTNFPPPPFATPPENRNNTAIAFDIKNKNLINASTSNNKRNGTANNDNAVAASAAVHPQPVIDEALFKRVHESLVTHSSGLSVEQLEQVNSALMATVWKTRLEWNRIVVAKAVEMAFNDVIEDITAMQKILPSSQEMQEQELRRHGGLDLGLGGRMVSRASGVSGEEELEDGMVVGAGAGVGVAGGSGVGGSGRGYYRRIQGGAGAGAGLGTGTGGGSGVSAGAGAGGGNGNAGVNVSGADMNVIGPPVGIGMGRGLGMGMGMGMGV